MKLNEIAEKFEITEYPEEFEQIYKDLNGNNTAFFNKEEFDKLEAEYGILEQYYDSVVSAAERLSEDKNLSLWVSIVCEFVKSMQKVRKKRILLIGA